MAEQLEPPEDLHSFAEMLVKQLVGKAPSAWPADQVEDAIQDLFLAGWADWKECGDVGLAKHRMKSRQANLLRDRGQERKRRKRTSSLPVVATDDRPDPADRPRSGELFALELIVNERLDMMPATLRRIAQSRIAGMTNQEIADEMEISLRSVERSLETLRKEMTDAETR